jgi:hypothetical protein
MNQVIKVLNKAHGAKVIEYWKSIGVDTKIFTGNATAEAGDNWIYYGVINDRFDNYSLGEVKNYKAEIIELPKDIPQYVECVIELIHAKVGKIYPVIDFVQCICENNVKYYWKEAEFKPSTKEAYDAQNSKPREWKVGDWLIRTSDGSMFNCITKDKAYQVVGLGPTENTIYVINDESRKDYFNKSNFRLAEPHEIPKEIKEFSVGTYVVFLQGYGSSNIGDVDEIILEYSPGNDYRYPKCKKEGQINKEPEYVKWFATKEEATEFSKTLTTKKQETVRTITHTQAQQIIDIACPTWKDYLFTKWGKKIVLKQSIEISDDYYQEMRKACTSEQNQLFDEIFGTDSKFKVGDWIVPLKPLQKNESHGRGDRAYQVYDVNFLGARTYNENGEKDGNGFLYYSQARLATEEEIQKAQYIPEGTPCLVRYYDDDTWKLAYSNGDGKFKTGIGNHSWKYVQVLDMNNLPKY